MFFKNTMFYLLKIKKKQKIVFLLSNMFSCCFSGKNKKLFQKTIIKQAQKTIFRIQKFVWCVLELKSCFKKQFQDSLVFTSSSNGTLGWITYRFLATFKLCFWIYIISLNS